MYQLHITLCFFNCEFKNYYITLHYITINHPTEPMVREEQYNCTSSGALNTVALQQRKDKVPRPIPVAAKDTLFQKTRSSVFN